MREDRGGDRRRDVDRGTGLGRGTSALTAILRLPVRAGRALGRMGGGTGRVARRALATTDTALRAVARRLGAVIRPVAQAFGTALAAIGIALRAARPVLVVLGVLVLAPFAAAWLAVQLTTVASVGIVLTVFAVPLAVAVGVVFGIVWVVATIGRAMAPAVARAARRVAAAIGRAARTAGRALTMVGRSFTAVGRVVGHALSAIGRVIGHALTTIGRVIGHALTTIGRVIGHALSAIGRVIGHALSAIGRVIGHGLARVLRPVAGAVGQAGRSGTRAMGALLRPMGTWLGRSVGRLGDRVAAAALATAAAVGALGRRVRHSVGVAVSRAREERVPAGAWDPGPAHRARAAGPAAMPTFTIEAFHSAYIPAGGTRVDVILRVATAAAVEERRDGPASAEVILVDCSGSMGHPWRKIRHARAATRAAIDALPDGSWFAVVRANHDTEVIFPPFAGLVRKTTETADAAARALHRLVPDGGTAMGRWLQAARELLDGQPDAIPHAILLTDGRNESETAAALAAALRACRGRFRCDCRGVGTDWDVDELTTIADAMLGTCDIVASPEALADDFHAMAAAAADRFVDRVTLQVWTPADATIRSFRQVLPYISDLDGRPSPVDAHTTEFGTGAWAAETREYHLVVDLPTRAVGSEALAARVGLAVRGRRSERALVAVEWTDDVERAMRIVPEVAHVTGQVELQRAAYEGEEARRRGDVDRATVRFGDAVRLAHETGNHATLDLLAALVDVQDAARGRVRLRDTVDDADAMAVVTGSRRTTRLDASGSGPLEQEPGEVEGLAGVGAAVHDQLDAVAQP